MLEKIMPRKQKGGEFLATINEMGNVNNLNYNKPYQEFNYDKYMGSIRQSNFAGGGTSKKVDKIMHNLYKDYKNGKMSYFGGYVDLFPVKLQEMQNTKDLSYDTPFQYSELKRLQTVPTSKFAFLRE
jgi:hypothetical protein